MKILALFSALLIAVTATQAAEKKPASHVSRETAIQLLRHEGILHGATRVDSAHWQKNIREWLITLRHPGGELSAWFVDAQAKNYHGGPCKH